MATVAFKSRKGTAEAEKPATITPDEQPETPAASVEPEAPATETTDRTVATRADKTVALPTPLASDMQGDWDRGDIRLPRINLIHKTSDNALIKAFGIGSFAYDKEVKLSDGETPVEITCLVAIKDYVQKLPYGDSEMPATFKSAQEVLDNGGSLNYKDADSGNYFQERAHLQLVVAMPEGTDEAGEALFPYEFEGKAYGMALMTVVSSAFTSVGKEIATLRNNNKVMRNGLWLGRLNLTSEVKKNSKNSWHIPVVKYVGEVPAALAEFYHSLI